MLSLQFNNLKGKQAFQYIMFALAIFLPGLGFIYVTNTDLFLNIDVTKLILLSILYTIPLMIIWVAAENEEEDKNVILIKISYYTLMSFYIFIMFYQIDYISKTFNPFVSFYAITILLAISGHIDNNRRKRKK